MSPRISIIIPVYNVEKYLDECLQSITSQTFTDFEAICVDDGSTDSSGNIVDCWAKKDARIRIIHKENGGLSSARNTGMEMAGGEYICFVDSDDMLVENALEVLDTAARKYNVDMFTYETTPLLYENANLRDPQKDAFYEVTGDYSGIKSGMEYFTEAVEGKDYVDGAWVVMLRNEWLKQQQIFFSEGKLFEDADFVFRCLSVCNKTVHLKERLYIYRIRDNSIMTSRYSIHQAECRLWVTEILLREALSGKYSQREVNAIVEYALGHLYQFKFISNHLGFDDLERLHETEGIDHFLVTACEIQTGKGIFNRELYLRGIMDVTKTSGKVILYGAGIVGRKTYQTLNLYHALGNVIGYAVTACDKPYKQFGLPVKSLDQYEATDDTVILVTAGGKNHMAMIDYARGLGFKKFYLVDYKIESYMDELLSTVPEE